MANVDFNDPVDWDVDWPALVEYLAMEFRLNEYETLDLEDFVFECQSNGLGDAELGVHARMRAQLLAIVGSELEDIYDRLEGTVGALGLDVSDEDVHARLIDAAAILQVIAYPVLPTAISAAHLALALESTPPDRTPGAAAHPW